MTQSKILQDRMYIIILCVFLLSYIFWMLNIFEPDFFHMANTGRELLTDLSNLYHNDNFIISGYDTLIQQWLYCIIIYKVYDVFGYNGITFLILLQFSILCFVYSKLSQEFGVSKKMSIIVALLAIIPFDYLNIRPQMFSITLLCIELIILKRCIKYKTYKSLYFLPILTLIEMNFHMTFWVFHYIVILPYIFPLKAIYKGITNCECDLVEEKIPIIKLIVPLILMTLTLFMNPYGLKGIKCLFDSASIKDLQMFELTAPPIVSEDFTAVLLGTAVLLYVYFIKQLNTADALLFLGLAFLNTLAVRNCTFYSLACVYSCSLFFKHQDITNLEKYLFQKTKKIFLIFISMLLIYLPIKASFSLKLGKTLPKDILIYLQNNEEDLSDVSIFADLNVSSYFLWEGVGKTFAESKTEPYLKTINGKQDILKDYSYYTKYATTEELDNFFELYKFDYVCIPSGYTTLRNYFSSNNKDYVLVCTDTNKTTIYNHDIPLWQLYKYQGG